MSIPTCSTKLQETNNLEIYSFLPKTEKKICKEDISKQYRILQQVSYHIGLKEILFPLFPPKVTSSVFYTRVGTSSYHLNICGYFEELKIETKVLAKSPIYLGLVINICLKKTFY